MARRTHLLNIEKNIQNIWKEHGIYEKDFVDASDKKFMGNFPYPYMNGLLHVGHAFTLSKLDFLTRYKSMVCDNALLPFAFHCTGTPIVVCADKLRNELKLKENSFYDFEKKEKQNDAECINLNDGKREHADELDNNDVHKGTDTTVFRSHKSKAQAKGGKQNSQMEIMKQMDIPESDIHLFQNPEYWCHYFSDKAQEHLNLLGVGCDWRRAFITTKINPYYDKFVKWQFNKLYEKNLIYYGTRITIFSKVNNQACADHERSEGEGVKCQEYTLIKIYIDNNKQFFDIFMKHKEFQVQFEKDEEHLQKEMFSESFFNSKKIALLGGTLKPETAYGQNYTFVNPNEHYYLTLGFSKQVLNFGTKNYVNNIMTKEEIMKNCEYIYICSENSLYNLAYQGIIPMLKIEEESIRSKNGSGSKITATTNDTSANNVKDRKANDLSDLFILNKLKGEYLIGLKTHTNLSKIKNIYILPMTSIKMNVSTAVVPCVSSDSADDYACLEEIRRKKNYYCEKYHLKEEDLNNASFSCIELPDIGTHTGKYFCEQEKITSYKDSKLLKIKDILYKRQFFEGTMTMEEYLGMKTAKCRKLVKQYILKNNEGFLYNEPESLVMDRNNVKCIAALCNQWYINYGNVEFKRDVLIQLKKHNFQTYSDVLFKQLQHVIFWLDDWSCSRAYGLGTEVPCFGKRKQEMDSEIKVETNAEREGMNPKEKETKDESDQKEVTKMADIKEEGYKEKELIESLSDSTIYMAYYTISHFLQGNVDGSKKGLLNIDAKDINDEFFDYVFDISDDTSKINKNISKEKLEEMRKEFRFWYPFDVRISGKDLIFNHLTMSLFNHVAIWGKKVYNKNKDSGDEKNGMDLLERQTEILNEIESLNLDEYETIKYFPKSFFCNGHVLINKEKMSKSKGNFITLQKCIALYSSDGTRVALADAGDTIEDANFNTDTANSAIMKLYNLINFCIETKNNVYIFRCGEKTFNDLIFENEINYLTNKCKDAYEKLQFRDVLKYGFYDMLLKRDIYRQMCDKINMHKDIINFFIERICLIISPIIPHVTEHIWTYILKKEKFLMKQKWPASELTKFSIVMHKQYINLLNVVENFRKSYDKVINKLGKSKKGGANAPGEKEKEKKQKNKKNSSSSSINDNNDKENRNEQKEMEKEKEKEKEEEDKGKMACSKDKLQNNVEDEEEEETDYKAVVYVATEYNNTQKKVIEILNNIINNSEDKKLPPNFISLLVENEYIKTLPKNEKKDILGFATFLVKDNVTLNNNQYELSLPYDEVQLIKKNVDFIKRSLNLSDIQVFQNTKKYEIDNTDIATLANPGNPSIFIHKSDT